MVERTLRLLQRAPDDVRPVLETLTTHVGILASEAGKDLQFEFGKDHVAFIIGCNQFMRMHFRGPRAGKIVLPETAGVTGLPPDEKVFRMFGWQVVPAHEGLIGAVTQAFEAAATKAAPT